MFKLPAVGEVYLHVNGLAFTVNALAFDREKEEVHVIHTGADGRIWTRTVGNFVGLHATNVPRFTLHQSTDARP